MFLPDTVPVSTLEEGKTWCLSVWHILIGDCKISNGGECSFKDPGSTQYWHGGPQPSVTCIRGPDILLYSLGAAHAVCSGITPVHIK